MTTTEALSLAYAAKNAVSCNDEMDAQHHLMLEYPPESILHIFVKNREYLNAIRILERSQ